ncbi:RHS repeat-associated core domain-containing protein [uncultured Clostridium sp.]|uniref:RHS repeat-associated core domain-containing protein n=1 Tax=uncultured Clostridium sp. TaxID=59620 RepID=UPI0028E7526B|nr:RHS repeat-associated core domain-containing protein [uncultured Clostridium sp.]
MNRLKEASYDGRSESFTYDKVGNRLTKTTNDITEKYVYNVKNQLKELHNNSVINHFTYDKQGNTIKEETTTGNNIFEYNTLNQQVKAITKEGNTLVSRYDAEGLRAEIEENEKLTKFIFHKYNVLVEADKDFNVISRFTRGYEVVAADIAEANEGSENNLNRYYYTTDEQGSTAFITDKNQKVRNEYCYDAFGNVLEAQEQVHNRITYTGQQFDGMIQQYYLRSRFYNPVIGRFTREDIYRGDGLNLYAYCGNNPVVYYDPSGYNKEEVCVGKGRSAAEGGSNPYGLTSKDIPSVRNDEFNKFFNSLTSEELDAIWKDPKLLRQTIEDRLRQPGGLHEWHLVSRTPQFKNWNVTAEQIKDLRSLTTDVKFVNPKGAHGGRGSTTAHNELLKIIDSSTDYDTFIRRLNNWANYRLDGGIDSLPKGLQLK